MQANLIRLVGAYLTVFLIIGTAFYALVLSPFALGELEKGAFIGFAGAAIQWVFGTATAGATASQQQSATTAGAVAGAMVPGSPNGGSLNA